MPSNEYAWPKPTYDLPTRDEAVRARASWQHQWLECLARLPCGRPSALAPRGMKIVFEVAV